MSYNPELQYRCTIIRGKTIKMLDDLLPAYASIIDELCPCSKKNFKKDFNNRLEQIIKDNSTKKTLDNHRTEIAGKLFGMYYEENDAIYTSERTEKYLEDSDQPAFFKDICLKFQFPNGMDKLDKVKDRLDKKVSIRQFPFILKTLLLAKEWGMDLTRDDIGYYILNSLQVLQGKVSPKEVLDQIKKDNENGVINKVRVPEGKASSYSLQHIREQLNYLELANLISLDGNLVSLTTTEMEDIKFIAKYWDEDPHFDVYKYDLDIEMKDFYNDWQHYYSNLNNERKFHTTVASLKLQIPEGKGVIDKIALGDEGESFVLNYEKERVKSLDPLLARKVVHLGDKRGIGYDIQSVVGEKGDESEFVKYIEVKSTKRVTVPNYQDSHWMDSVNLTRNEWVAAAQHRKSYFLYRVYFTPGLVIIFILQDPFTKSENGTLRAKPTTYRVDFSNIAVDSMIKERKEDYS